jgi:hypothetical protein
VGTRRPIMSKVEGQDLEPNKTLMTKIAKIYIIIIETERFLKYKDITLQIQDMWNVKKK